MGIGQKQHKKMGMSTASNEQKLRMACMMKVNINYAKIGRYILELEHTLTDDK
jgi:hypothetical protein